MAVVRAWRWSVLLAAALVSAGCATLQSASDFDPPTVELVGIRPAGSDGMEARFDIALRVVNPNARPLEVQGLYAELFVQDKKLVTGASAEPVTLPAYGETRVTVNGSASLFGSVALIANLMEARPENGVGYELKVKISVAGLPSAVRISRTGTFGARAH